MPWKIEEQDGKFCVVKEADGSTEKCHASKDEAEAHLKALYASEEKSVTAQFADIFKAVDDALPPSPEGTPVSTITFTGDFKATDSLPEEVGADAKPEADAADPEAEGETPATEATVNVPTTIRKLTLNIGEEVPAEKALFERIWEGVKARLGWKDVDDDTATGMKVAGNHWWITYSNNFQDRDKEVFPETAIDRYVERVDKGIVSPPDLWVWHVGKQVNIGKADWVARHGHFIMAAGEFASDEKSLAAKSYYAAHAKDTGISHGFTFPANQFDGKHYHEFNTFEISLLPRGAEANWYTSLEGVKEMPLNDEKKKYLETVFGKDHAERILADWDKRGKALEELGVEFKAFTGNDVPLPEEAAKAAVDAAEKTFGVLLEEILSTDASVTSTVVEVVKQAKAVKDDNALMRKEIDALRAEMELRPRIASQDTSTAIDTTKGKGAELLDTVQKQMAETDKFWGTTVIKS